MKELKGYGDAFEEAEGFFRCVKNGERRKSVFTIELRFNLLTMAIEKYFMTIFMKHGILPENHTFTDMCSCMDQLTPLNEAIQESLFAMDRKLFLCNLSTIINETPKKDEFEVFVSTGDYLRNLASDVMSGKNLNQNKEKNYIHPNGSIS